MERRRRSVEARRKKDIDIIVSIVDFLVKN